MSSVPVKVSSHINNTGVLSIKPAVLVVVINITICSVQVTNNNSPEKSSTVSV